MAAPRLRLEHLAAEVLCQVFSELDIESAISLASTNLQASRVFRANWAAILFPILQRDFSPVETLLGISGPLLLELGITDGSCVRRPIYFGGRLACEGAVGGTAPPFSYQLEHMRPLIRICRVIRGWEAAFPRLRFAHRAQFARSLHAHENERLRDALYSWWRYSVLFHQDLIWPSPGTSARMGDIRCDNLRTLSTAQLYELQDLWETVNSAVATDLCPSVALVLQTAGKSLSQAEASRLGWGHAAENERVVATVTRLSPDQLLHFLESRHVYATKSSLTTAMRLLRPSLEKDVESLSEALRAVLCERRELLRNELGHRALKRKRYFPPRSFPKPQGGVLDYRAQRWQKVRVKYGNDAGKGLVGDDSQLTLPPPHSRALGE